MGATRIVEVAPERYEGWLARFADANPDPATGQRVVATDRFDHDPLAVLLIRRGGYAVGLARGGALAAHKVGRRHVQSRTAAGGWSQQRFARRRAGQAAVLVDAVTEHLVRILGEEAHGIPAGVIVGGDRLLVADVLSDPRLSAVAAQPRREFYDLPDPDRKVLDDAVQRGRAVRVSVVDP